MVNTFYMKDNEIEEDRHIINPGDLVLFLDENSYARLEIGMIIVETSVPSAFQILAYDGTRNCAAAWFHIWL